MVTTLHTLTRQMHFIELALWSFISAASYSYVAPDGGYGWVVVAASFLVNMIADGVTFSFGVMFEEFEQESVHTTRE